MPMVESDLADKIAKALNSKDGATPEITNTAKAFVAVVKGGIFMHALVNGTAPPGGPLQAGAAEGGVILLPLAATLPVQIAAALKGPPTPQIMGLAMGFATHIQTGLVSFASGNIMGACTNTALTPGPVLAGGQNGQIKGLSGSALSSLWSAPLGGKSKEIDEMAKVVAEYFSKEAMGSYVMGTVTGVAPPGGGPVVAVGAGGTFS